MYPNTKQMSRDYRVKCGRFVGITILLVENRKLDLKQTVITKHTHTCAHKYVGVQCSNIHVLKTRMFTKKVTFMFNMRWLYTTVM